MNVRRKALLYHTLGQHEANNVDLLKALLGVDKLELVMLDNMEEYIRLLAAEGIPLAREGVELPENETPEETDTVL